MTPFPPQICLHLVLKSSPSWQVLLGDPPHSLIPKVASLLFLLLIVSMLTV